MRGDPVPQNFTDGVRPRWDERLVEVPNADGVAERSCAGHDAEERGAMPDAEEKRSVGGL